MSLIADLRAIFLAFTKAAPKSRPDLFCSLNPRRLQESRPHEKSELFFLFSGSFFLAGT